MRLSDDAIRADFERETLDNPYFREVAGGVFIGARDAISEKALWARRHRDELVETYAWAIPNDLAIRGLRRHEPLLEVGAGAGYWAWLVKQAEGDIVATDADPPDDPWMEVIEADAETAIEEFGADRTLFVCWPTAQGPWSTTALEAFDGDTVIYVGEGRTGLTGPFDFHRELFDSFNLVGHADIPHYLGIHDRMEVWERA